MLIIMQDNIGTDPDSGMATTGGNVALRDSMTIRNAAIVDRVRPRPFFSDVFVN